MAPVPLDQPSIQEFCVVPLTSLESATSVHAQAIREVLAQHGRLPGGADGLADETDLYSAGLTSLATVGIMLALEERFDFEFPETKLNRGTFRSISAIAQTVAELVG